MDSDQMDYFGTMQCGSRFIGSFIVWRLKRNILALDIIAICCGWRRNRWLGLKLNRTPKEEEPSKNTTKRPPKGSHQSTKEPPTTKRRSATKAPPKEETPKEAPPKDSQKEEKGNVCVILCRIYLIYVFLFLHLFALILVLCGLI
eukprot:766265_1